MGQSCCGGSGGSTKVEREEALKKKIDAVFDSIDSSHDGKVDTNEVIAAWKNLHPEADQDLAEENAKKMIKEFDTDGDGTISKKEFEDMMKDTMNDNKDHTNDLAGLAVGTGAMLFKVVAIPADAVAKAAEYGKDGVTSLGSIFGLVESTEKKTEEPAPEGAAESKADKQDTGDEAVAESE